MNKEFEDCLRKKRITEFDRAKGLVAKEIKLATADIKFAKDSFKNTNYKWATIQAYYAMFHAARSLLYSKGYRERSHFCLIVAIRSLYVEKGEFSLMLIEALQLGKRLRENADYYGEFSETAASQMLKDASEFIRIAKRLTK